MTLAPFVHNKAACALANKMARICYATLRDGESFTSQGSQLAKKLARTDFPIAT